MKNFNVIGAIIVLVGALTILIPGLMDISSNAFNLGGCVVMIVGFFVHILLNKRISTLTEEQTK